MRPTNLIPAILLFLASSAPAVDPESIPDDRRAAIIESIKARVAGRTSEPAFVKKCDELSDQIRAVRDGKNAPVPVESEPPGGKRLPQPGLKAVPGSGSLKKKPPLSKKAREELLGKLQQQLDDLVAAATKPAISPLQFCDTLPIELDRIKVGVYGRLPDDRVRVYMITGPRAAVFTTLAHYDDYTIGVNNFPVFRTKTLERLFYISGVDTTALADNAATTLGDVFYIVGNKRVGGTTYFHLMPLRFTADEAAAVRTVVTPLPAGLPAAPAEPPPAPKLMPDVTLAPPKGVAIMLASNAESLELYAKAVKGGNDKAAASMIERGIVVKVTEPLGVKVEYRGQRTASVRPVDGPLAGKTWAVFVADVPAN